mmetsp:Transcript_4822/g.5580  ORF Transcript_4822/g.5580 Transcript_4822/m.5580 type:complete len:99 (+) Transcript_4822:748-1044(+)
MKARPRLDIKTNEFRSKFHKDDFSKEGSTIPPSAINFPIGSTAEYDPSRERVTTKKTVYKTATRPRIEVKARPDKSLIMLRGQKIHVAAAMITGVRLA